MTMLRPFSGSYTPDDVQFLLKPVDYGHTPIHDKEALIQAGKKHYSEILSHEALPPDDYLALFHQAVAGNQDRMAKHLIVLAERIAATKTGAITLVSLARAGTPIGVLLKHILQRYFGIAATHYSISILRDIGIDQSALRFILKKHNSESLVFVDGWTGKGVIARQLTESLQAFAVSDGIEIPADLHVLADLSGQAAVAASSEDYLIPSCLLNATVSGLVSRSIYDSHKQKPGDFHSCVYYRQFEQHDLSRFFIETILARVAALWQTCHGQMSIETNRRQQQTVSLQFLLWINQLYGITEHTLIKPGIGEATRVLLRREAQLLLLQDGDCEATRHLRWLAESKAVPVTVITDLPYRAAALIKKIQS